MMKVLNSVHIEDVINCVNLSTLGIDVSRNSLDLSVNNYGNRLLQLCQNIELLIANGRLGKDKGIGALTCKNTTIVDYCILSLEVLPFDPMISDVYNALHVKILCKLVDVDKCMNSDGPSTIVKAVWDSKNLQSFNGCLNDENIVCLNDKLDAFDIASVNKDSINSLIEEFHNIIIQAASECDDIDCNAVTNLNVELNSVITVDEVVKAIKSLKNNKSSGTDLILNEFLKNSCQKMIDIYVKMFNIVFKSGKIPDLWSDPLATTLKLEKRKLRSKVRMEQAVSRQSLYQHIMDNPNTQLFYRLINRNRSSQQTSTNCLKINGELNFIPEDQRRSFASYYEDLSVSKEELFDNNYLNLCKIRQQLYEQAMDQSTVEPELFTDTEVMKAVDELNTKKSADEFGISAEHLKYSKTTITPALTSIFNNILLNKAVPTAFTFGLLTPVLKKQKDPTIMGNYRGITVTATIGKTFEYAFIGKLNLKSKTLLQFGFTEGLSPIMSSLLISEARYEIKKSTEKILYICSRCSVSI
ncbi:Hypothetical predicted protein [Mytilus galloprovincialis]|uniref:Uncharacterized protein n=1 Tax=Mytilus galloprovincialis TaxID=29158 RepID=A0A8B6EUF5_MYTGA|nr:Hypothetical predicted protein [Mytilus galloprovincialis]